MAKTKAVYAGMFDPLTLGHCSIIEKANRLPFDEIVIAITQNTAKSKGRFELADRSAMVTQTLDWMGVSGKVSAEVFMGQFLVHFCKEIQATHIIRGIRDARDFEYEMQVVETNCDIDNDMDHILIPCDKQYQRISSTLVMGLIGPKGWHDVVKKYVPRPVYERLLTYRRT